MPAIGEFWRNITIQPDEETLRQHVVIDDASKLICETMFALAPEPKKRRWHSSYGVHNEGEKISYIPTDDPRNEVTVWLDTIHFGRRAFPNTPPHVEVALVSQVRAIAGAFYGKKGFPEPRVAVHNNALQILRSGLSVFDLKSLPFEQAISLLTDVYDTLELIKERTGKAALLPYRPYALLGRPDTITQSESSANDFINNR